MKANNKLHKIILLILILSLTACTGKPSAVLQDTTCKAPCWHNIEVGKTKIDQAINLLSQVPEVDPRSIKRGKNYQTLDERVTARFQNSKESWLEIIFLEEKAIAMYFIYEEAISLSDAITKFGEPKFVFTYALKGDPTVYLTAQFLYPDQGVCLFHHNRGLILQIPETYRITSATNITEIYYVDPAITNGQIDYGCFTGINENDLNSRKQDWKGFSNYSIP